MLAPVADADRPNTVRKKYSVSLYSEAEPHAMYAMYKQTRTLSVLQYRDLLTYLTISPRKARYAIAGILIELVNTGTTIFARV